jgi:hypothetical protein
MRPGPTASLARAIRLIRSSSETLLHTRLVMPSTVPPNRLIEKVTEPMQCAMTCNRRPPMCRRSSRSAAGWSKRATWSRVSRWVSVLYGNRLLIR